VTTAEALIAASGLPRREARALLAEVCGVTRETLVAQPRRPVDDSVLRSFDALAQRRRAGEPFAYLVGRQEFFGRNFAVSPAVLVPRPETEELVQAALERLAAAGSPSVIDLGTGSGCIAITIALERPAARVLAVDASADALAVAAGNAAALGAQVEFRVGNWWQAIEGPFDLALANPPYVAPGDPHLQALQYEPAGALVAAEGGLAALRAVIEGAPARLARGAWLLLEHGHDQAAAVRAMLTAAKFESVGTLLDAAGIERTGCGRMPAD
jgi:release factor glutamine methyltransferase